MLDRHRLPAMPRSQLTPTLPEGKANHRPVRRMSRVAQAAAGRLKTPRPGAAVADRAEKRKRFTICDIPGKGMARVTRLELATSGVTGRHSNQLSYTRACPAKHWASGRGAT